MELASGTSRLTFGGLASGLDTGAIIEALIDVERQPLVRMQAARGEIQQRQSLFQGLNSLFLGLRDAARALDNMTDNLAAASPDEEFLSYQVRSSDEAAVQATITGDASPGTLDLTVSALARAGRRGTVGFATTDSTISNRNNRNVTIDYGGDQPIVIDVDKTTTLQELADAIEADPNNDGSVRSDLIFDGSEHRLVISGTQTGAANDVDVSTNVNGLLDPAVEQLASDAQLNLLGVDVTRASNEIGDLLPGVTLELRAPSPTPVSILVSRDDEAIAGKLQALVSAYNAIRDFSLSQSAVDEDGKARGPLSGDSTLRGLERRAQAVVSDVFTFTDNPYSSLASIGVSFDSTGRLELDEAVLTQALDTDRLGVRELLSGDGSSEGVATALGRVLEPIVRPADGLLALRGASFEDELRDVDRRIEDFESRLAAREETMILRFTQLETLISSLQSQSSFLASLAGVGSSRS